MTREIVSLMRPDSKGTYVDATLGEGGHASALLEVAGPGGRVLGFDRDPEIVEAARARLAGFGVRCLVQQGDYRDLAGRLAALGIEQVSGIVIDLGLSSYHLDRADRGFSFRFDGPLDMRFDRTRGETAADLLGRLSESELCRLLQSEGEERWARRIARAIVRQRASAPMTTTGQLAALIERAVPTPARYGRIHPATRTFQALRIAVNRELEGLAPALVEAVGLLAPGGTLCVLTYQSSEDRVVKHQFKALAAAAQVELLTKRPLRPAADEVADNPRARSAKLRAVRRPAAAAIRRAA